MSEDQLIIPEKAEIKIEIRDFADACKLLGITNKHLKNICSRDRCIELFVQRVNALVPAGEEKYVQLPALVETIYNQLANGARLIGYKGWCGLGGKGGWGWNHGRRKNLIHREARSEGSSPLSHRGRGVKMTHMEALFVELKKGGLRDTIIHAAAKLYSKANGVPFNSIQTKRQIVGALSLLAAMGLLHHVGPLYRVKSYTILEDAPNFDRDSSWMKMTPQGILENDKK
jgi:hypothetical protein